MEATCPQCQGPIASTVGGGLFAQRCVSCGWEQSCTAYSPDWFKDVPAVEVERPFWVAVQLGQPLTAAQLRAIRAVEPGSSSETAQSFMARLGGASELQIGPFWQKYRAVDALRVLSDAGLKGTLGVGA